MELRKKTTTNFGSQLIQMQALEKLIRKINNEAIKSPKDVSDIIPSDTLDILTKDDSSSGKQLLHIFFF